MKKVVFVDHSFHTKTKSSEFILDLLREKYEVDIVWDSYWYDGKEPDLSFVDERYFAVIFWQSVLPQSLNNLRCKNIIFFPMYDACCFLGVDYWYSIKDLKIMSFSKKLFTDLNKLRFQAMHTQYYPAPIEPNTGEPSVFFWNRTNDISWSIVKKLIENAGVTSVHIHKAVDPFNNFDHPSKEDEMAFHITYSEWFNSKEDYIRAVKDKSIYIAPRKSEGIGFSFLEAMAMGRAVIAVDSPTMNEYINDGVNGYLFSLDNPQPIDFRNSESVQENAYQTIVEGRKRWDMGKHKILDFIEEAPRENDYFENTYRRKIIVAIMMSKVKKVVKYMLPYGIVRLYQKYKGMQK